MEKITGLINVGNTCFMNCILQLLIGCPKLVDLFLNNKFENELIKYQKTFIDYFDDKTKTLGPMILYNRYKLLNKNYTGMTQEDAHEYLTFTIDDIHELSKNLNLDIKSLFEIGLESKVTCLECNHFSSVKINENFLSLNINEDIDLLTSFNDFFKSELLNDEDRWHCDKCKNKVNSEKKIELTKLPDYLFINLNRISMNNNILQKNVNDIEYPMEWTVDKKYYLRGIIYHMGNIFKGHYICAITRNGNEWFIIDDTNISKISIENMKFLRPHISMLMYQTY